MVCVDLRHKEVCFHGDCICSLHCLVLPCPGTEDLPSLLLGSLVSSHRSGGGERAGCSMWGNPSSTSFVPPGHWMGMAAKSLL